MCLDNVFVSAIISLAWKTKTGHSPGSLRGARFVAARERFGQGGKVPQERTTLLPVGADLGWERCVGCSLPAPAVDAEQHLVP